MAIGSEKVYPLNLAKSLRKAINELENCGYIERSRERNEKGQLTDTIYTIREKPLSDKPTLENPTQLNTNISSIEKSNTEFIKYQSNQSRNPAKPIDTDRIERYREIIYENIEYDVTVLNEPKDKEYIDEIVEVMLECVIAEGVVKIGGQEYSSEVVKSRMLKIDSSHIEYILHCLNKNTAKVRNIKAYLKTTIFNAPTTLNSFYRAEVNHDFG